MVLDHDQLDALLGDIRLGRRAGAPLIEVRHLYAAAGHLLHLFGQPAGQVPFLHVRRVTIRASRWPSVPAAACNFAPFFFLRPSNPARPPLSGVDCSVRASKITADGSG